MEIIDWKKMREGIDYDYINALAANAYWDVDVLMFAFNHGRFIGQAIESVLGQKTEYRFRLLIAEDCSQDDTASIVRKYQSNHPDKIASIIWRHNGGMSGRVNGIIASQYLNAPFLCYLEGDDYWTDMNKLQKQAAFLNEHPAYIGVTGNVRNVNEDGSKQHRDFELYAFQDSHVYGKNNVLARQQLSHISALMHRNIWKNWNDRDWDAYYQCKMNGDVKTGAILGMLGRVYYSGEIYGDHRRVFTGSSWTAQTSGKDIRLLKIEMWESLRDYIRDCFHETIQLQAWKEAILSQPYPENDGTVPENRKQRNIARMLGMWLRANGGGNRISDFLQREGIERIVIFGMSILGVCLYQELQNTNVRVLYALERKPFIPMPELRICKEKPLDEPEPDAVIVTAITTYDSIRDRLLSEGYSRVYCLDEFLYRMVPEDPMLRIKTRLEG